MALKIEQIENRFAYINNDKKAKRTSHKEQKRQMNKKMRQIASDPENEHPKRQYRGWEF